MPVTHLGRAQVRDTIMLRGPGGVLTTAPIGAVAALYEVGTSVPIAETIYADEGSTLTLPNPVPTGGDGSLEFWLANERELDVVVTATGYGAVRTTLTADSAQSAAPISGIDVELRAYIQTIMAVIDPDGPPSALASEGSGGLGGVGVGPGSASAPTMTFEADSNTGLYNSNPDELSFTTGGSQRWLIDASGDWLAATDNLYDIGASGYRPRNVYVAGSVTVGTTLTVSGNTTVAGTAVVTNAQVFGWLDFQPGSARLWGAAGNVIEQRNGTTGQNFYVYDTYTDASNYERLRLGVTGANFILETQQAGTGAAQALMVGTVGNAALLFRTNNVIAWRIDSSGGLDCWSDNAFDIGHTGGANRPRTIYVGTSVVTPLLDTALFQPTGNVIEQRNGTNPQNLRVYNTYTDASNYERLGIYWTGNNAHIRPENAGTGVARTLVFALTWQIGSSGHFQSAFDISYDIGGPSSGRPRDIYVGRNLEMTGNIQWSGANATRIKGPYSSGTPSNDCIFQTRSSNSQTVVPCMPSGTSKDAAYRVYGSSDPDNAAYIQLVASTTDVGFTSDKTGTGVVLPFRFGMAGTNAMRIETSSLVTVEANRFIVRGWATDPTSGVGLSLGYHSPSTASQILSYDYAAASYRDMVISAKTLTLSTFGGGKLTLPANSVQQLIGTWAGAGVTTTAVGSWVATSATSGSVACSGAQVRIEACITLTHTVAGGSGFVGLMIDGAIYSNLIGFHIPSPGYQIPCTFITYYTPTAGNHTFTLAVQNNAAGTLSSAGVTSFYVTEQKF